MIYELVAGSSLKEKAHLWRTHGIVNICLRRHLVLRLLFLWQSGEANGIPQCVPQNQLWLKNIMLTQCCFAHKSGS